MRAKSLTWARVAGPALMLGLFLMASATASAQAQPRRPGHARAGEVRNLGRKRLPVNRAPRFKGVQPGAANRGIPGRGANRRGVNRRGGRPTPPRRLVGHPVQPPAMAARPAVRVTRATSGIGQTAAQKNAKRLAALKQLNKDKGLVGGVVRHPKGKGSLANQILFYILFALCICFSLVTVTRRSPLMAALSLLVVFLCLAGVYLFLQAPFMAAIQLIVYAGAVIVLFVFVIMSIGFDDVRGGEDIAKEILYFAMAFLLTGAGAFVFHAGSGLAYIAGFAAMELLALAFIVLGKLRYPVTRFLGIAAVTFALAQVVRLVQLSPVSIGKTLGMKTAPDAPAQVVATPAGAHFGNAKAIGQAVFTDNVFAFEALSLLLLASIVAAVVIVRSRKEKEEQTS